MAAAEDRQGQGAGFRSRVPLVPRGVPLVRLPASPAAVRGVTGVVPALLRRGDVVVELAGPAPADLRLVDALARLSLAARGCPGALEVRGADPALGGLSRLLGLAAALHLGDPDD